MGFVRFVGQIPMNTDPQLDTLLHTVCHLSSAFEKAVVARKCNPLLIRELRGRLASARRDLEHLCGCPIAEIRVL